MEDSKEVKMTDLVNELQILKDRTTQLENARQDQLSIAIISGDMDKIMAGMIIALAAAAMDTKVKLFFSFWGISALRDPKKNVKGKSFISKMFGMMLPKSKNKLKLSKYNMLGMSPIIMKKLICQSTRCLNRLENWELKLQFAK